MYQIYANCVTISVIIEEILFVQCVYIVTGIGRMVCGVGESQLVVLIVPKRLPGVRSFVTDTVQFAQQRIA